MMNKIMNPSWWMSMFMSTFMTLCFIYLMKLITSKIEIPVVSNIVQSA